MSRRIAVLVTLVVCAACFTGCTRGVVAGLTEVKPGPAITFNANPTSVAAGQNVTLSWSSTNANAITIDNGIGAVSLSGSMSVSPKQTTTYTATATGATGTSTAHVVINVSTPPPTVTITAAPASITRGQSVTLTVVATSATQVAVTNSVDQNSTTLAATGGTATVKPTTDTTYTATATGATGQTATATVAVAVTIPKDVTAINHVIFLMQENRSFDNYFGMLNPYRKSQHFNVGDDGKEYDVDGIDDKLNKFANQDDEGDSFGLFKLTSSCVDDMSSAWLESYGDVNRFDFSPTRPLTMDGFVHTAEGFGKSGAGDGQFTDTTGRRAMGYYDQDFLNYYYFMASQFALSDRWFSPVASKTVPNRIATMSGGTTQGLTRDPALDDGLGSLALPTIFEKMDDAKVSWKIYYSATDGECSADGDCPPGSDRFPATSFGYFNYSLKYVYDNPGGAPCQAPTQGSKQAVGDPNNSFCIDTSHIAPLSQFFTDLKNGTLPNFAYIEPGYGLSDEHPGSQASIMIGQQQVASLMNAFMSSPSWQDSVFFFSFDEGGGPFDHVPPVPGHSNDFTDASLGLITDISSIAVNPDQFLPCVGSRGNPHCDLHPGDPGANPGDAPAQQGFAAQLGFRLPNFVVSPFSRKHYVSHVPMDHTAIIKFVESRFIGKDAHLTARDAAQPDLLDFFDFNNTPWKTPPSPPTPVAPGACHADNMGP